MYVTTTGVCDSVTSLLLYEVGISVSRFMSSVGGWLCVWSSGGMNLSLDTNWVLLQSHYQAEFV